jgi:predicted alpha/beta-fold hydrolase
VRKYHTDVSSVHHLHKIEVPVFCLSALDDPVVTADCIPYDDIMHNPNMMLAVTNTGGHIGWYQGIKYP